MKAPSFRGVSAAQIPRSAVGTTGLNSLIEHFGITNDNACYLQRYTFGGVSDAAKGIFGIPKNMSNLAQALARILWFIQRYDHTGRSGT